MFIQGYSRLLALFAGLSMPQFMPWLPPWHILVLLCMLCLLLLLLNSFRNVKVGFIVLIILFLVGLTYSCYNAQARLNDNLQRQHHDKVSQLTIQVSGLATYARQYVQFPARVLSSKPAKGIPQHILLTWSGAAWGGPYTRALPPTLPVVKPGQIWQLSALLKTPQGLLNPGQSERRNYLFVNNYRATGDVKGTPKLLAQKNQTISLRIELLRDYLRNRLNKVLQDKRYGAVMIALVMGDQQGITQEDWLLFNRSGITHLVSISGSHITMLAALGSLFLFWSWRFGRFKGKAVGDYLAAQKAAGLTGLMIALGYCLLAGWGVPAQRTFLMLLIFYVSFILHVSWSIYKILLLVALIILFFDPWAILSVGFLLSFAAIFILMVMGQCWLKAQGYKQKIKQSLLFWGRTQILIFIALLPLLAFIFNQVSLISPLVNAYAIFLVGAVITPLCLLLALSVVVMPASALTEYLAYWSHALLQMVLDFTAYLTQWEYALLDVAKVPLWLTILSCVAIVFLILPKPYKRLRLLVSILLPVLWAKPSAITDGFWQLYVLDVGQGSAAIIRTKSHAVLFDTGLRSSPDNESAQRVIIPALRYLGIKQLDVVVVSHSDLDHAGGFAELISNVPVTHLYASFRLDHWLSNEQNLLNKSYTPRTPNLRFDSCERQQDFVFDGVGFAFLWPNPVFNKLPSKSPNKNSCVLQISGLKHSALILGDIATYQEQELVRNGLGPQDVVIVAHHGSSTSSAVNLINQVDARWVIAQTGRDNRYGHPHKVVVNRWQQAGSEFLDTARSGAIKIDSSPLGLLKEEYALFRQRYWHTQP